MLTHAPRISIASWFSQTGPEFDVIVSSRVLLHRSLSGYPLGNAVTSEQLTEIRKQVESVMADLEEDYQLVDPQAVRSQVRDFYSVRGLLPPDAETGVSFVNSTDSVALWIGGAEHLRLNAFAGGLDLPKALADGRGADGELEKMLEYAVSLHFGYLTAEIDLAGNGMTATVLAHLPALDKSGMIGGAAHEISRRRCVLKGLGSLGEEASLYALERRGLMGESEDDVIETLAEAARALVHYERAARKELVEGLGGDFHESVYRTFGTVRYARSLTEDEALQLLSLLRLGVSVGSFTDISLQTLTEMLFLSQSEQTLLLLQGTEGPGTHDTSSIARAEFLRRMIERI